MAKAIVAEEIDVLMVNIIIIMESILNGGRSAWVVWTFVIMSDVQQCHKSDVVGQVDKSKMMCWLRRTFSKRTFLTLGTLLTHRTFPSGGTWHKVFLPVWVILLRL